MPVAAQISSSMVSLFFNFPTVDFFSKVLITVRQLYILYFDLLAVSPPHYLISSLSAKKSVPFVYLYIGLEKN